MRVNLTTQNKVDFELVEGYNYFDCHCLFHEIKAETVVASKNGEVMWGEKVYICIQILVMSK